MNYIMLVLFFFGAACSFKKDEIANQVQNGHEELYSEPDEIEAPPKGFKRIVIAATNDIGGSYGTQAVKIRDSHHKNPLHIELGGVDFLASYIRILRSKYQSVVLVDSGDILPSDPDDQKFAQDFYSLLKYDAITPGLSDLSGRSLAGVHPVKNFAKNSSVSVLTSNLYELKTARGVEWKGTEQYELKEINGIKVGIIGLLPDDTSKLTPLDSRVGLYVENMLQSTLHQARRLRSLGAQIIVVLTHQGLECGRLIAEAAKLPLTKVNFEPTKEGACNLRSPMGEYLLRLPARLVDVVVGGRNHQKIANFVNGMAVISGMDSGKALSYVELFLDEKTNRLDPDKTVIHQPVMICREFFKETNDCYTEDPSVDHKERVPATFLGETVERDEDFRNKFRKFFDDVSVGSFAPEKFMTESMADIVFAPKTSGHSHLVLVELTGTELARWLEISFNQEEGDLWSPAPFSRDNDQLVLTIRGKEITASSKYRVLTDLESLQQRPALKKLITSNGLRSLPELSWAGAITTDEVNIIASGAQVP